MDLVEDGSCNTVMHLPSFSDVQTFAALGSQAGGGRTSGSLDRERKLFHKFGRDGGGRMDRVGRDARMDRRRVVVDEDVEDRGSILGGGIGIYKGQLTAQNHLCPYHKPAGRKLLLPALCPSYRIIV